LGTRVNALAPAFLQRRADQDARPAQAGFWYRLSRLVMRRPAPIAVASAALLIALGIPFLQIKFTSVDATVLPAPPSARDAATVLKADSPPNRDAPIRLAVSGANGAQLAALDDRVSRVHGVVAVEPPQRARGGVAEIDAISAYPVFSDRGQDVVREIRD